jgi:hypothetical protein
VSDIDKYYVYDRTPTGNKSTSDTNNLPGARIIDRERLAATSTGHEQKCVHIFAAGALLAEGELMLSSTSAHSNVAAPLQSSQECGASHDAELKQRSGKIEAMSKSAHETEASCWPDGTLWPPAELERSLARRHDDRRPRP